MRSAFLPSAVGLRALSGLLNGSVYLLLELVVWHVGEGCSKLIDDREVASALLLPLLEGMKILRGNNRRDRDAILFHNDARVLP
jgi:hypothetical protein